MKDMIQMAYDMDDKERALIEGVQKDFGKIKGKLKKLMAIQMQAGRGDAAHAAFASVTATNVAHVECTDRLFACFPDQAAPIVLKGGGGRG